MSDFVGEGSRRLLIVEDEKDLRECIGLYFRSKGFEVSEAPTAMEAINLLQSGGVAWDYLITDYSMPGMNGTDLIIWCSIWNIRFRNTILLSSNPPAKSKYQGLFEDFGVTVLEKPASLNQLLEVIQGL